jgi:hypothetical protein
MVLSAAVLVGLVIVAAVLGVRWWTWRPLVARRVVVQLDDGTSFEGVALSRRGPLLVLSDVTARVAGGSQRLDGVVVVERPRVLFVQVV